MRCVWVFLCLVVFPQAHGEATRYNSSDLSYLSNGIQFPAPESEFPNPVGKEYYQHVKEPEIQWLFDLFNHLKWPKYALALNNSDCRTDLATYIDELQNGTSWATKMYDSSGRYSGLFFFGNDYWLGSRTQCEELINPLTNPDIPPFPVQFRMAKIRININQDLTPVTRQLNVGECLPSSCTTRDIHVLLVQDQKPGTSLNIVGIRPVPGDYSLFYDIKFQIVGGIFFIVVLIMFIASLVELVTKKPKKSKCDAEVENNNNNNNNEERKTENKKEQRQNIVIRILLCFSAVNNGKRILDVNTVSEASIKCIHGLRFFSIAWIILVHTYLEVFSIGDNKKMRVLTERTFLYQTISNATFSVDTFFFISGLLVTITYFRTVSKKSLTREEEQKTCDVIGQNSLKFFVLLLYRFFRLTPAYLFVLGVNEVILRYLHSYSVFSPAIIDHISCSKFWWRNALYINNFFPQTEFCMLWSWYIANDSQFYVIAVILLLIAVRGNNHLKFAATALGLFMVTSWIITFLIAMKFDYTVRVEEPFALFDQLYDKPWMRIGPYFIGMMTGYFLFKVDCKVQIRIPMVILGWILSLACLTSLVYGVGRQGLQVPISAIYASLGHTAWGASLAWITIACSSGYGGPLGGLFSSKLFLPLSRLTYCAYLIHPVLMCYTSFILDGPFHINETFCIVIYFGNLLASFAAAFVISLAFESPVVNILKIVFH